MADYFEETQRGVFRIAKKWHDSKQAYVDQKAKELLDSFPATVPESAIRAYKELVETEHNRLRACEIAEYRASRARALIEAESRALEDVQKQIQRKPNDSLSLKENALVECIKADEEDAYMLEIDVEHVDELTVQAQRDLERREMEMVSSLPPTPHPRRRDGARTLLEKVRGREALTSTESAQLREIVYDTNDEDGYSRLYDAVMSNPYVMIHVGGLVQHALDRPTPEAMACFNDLYHMGHMDCFEGTARMTERNGVRFVEFVENMDDKEQYTGAMLTLVACRQFGYPRAVYTLIRDRVFPMLVRGTEGSLSLKVLCDEVREGEFPIMKEEL